MDLLFVMAHFHGLAKCRIHHDKTLEVMDAVTRSLGELLRTFSQDTCSAFATKELRREYNARVRRATASSASTGRGKTERHAKTFNLKTYKLHSLGDYITTIKTFGTMESYSTELVRDASCLLCKLLIFS